jgi:stage V sporulation protein SpoVS
MRSFRGAEWLALAAGLVAITAAGAEERSVSTATGEPVVFARHTQWRTNCVQNGLPAIKFDTQPAHGTASIAAGTNTIGVNHTNPGHDECLGKTMTGVVLSYQPEPDFSGTDTITYTVSFTKGRKSTNTVTVNVLPMLAGERPKRQEVAATARTAPPAAAPLKSGAAPAASGTRIALVIGNSAYQNVPVLTNPSRDAGAVAAALRATGFKTVELKNDLGREALNDALHAFAAEADRADWAMVYYAGHGIEVNGNNYLIPVDAKLAIDRDVEFEAIPLDRVMSAVGGARKLRLVLLDACRDDPFANRMRRSIGTRSMGRGLASVEPEAGTLVVFAGKAGQIALDGEDNSPFVASLTQRMMTPGLEIRRLFDYVRDDVLATTQRQQQPFSYGSLPGSEDYYFRTAAAKR